MIDLPYIHSRQRTFRSRFCALAAVCLLLTCCAKDDTDIPNSGASPSLEFSLRLGFPDPLTVATRVNPVGNPVKDGIELKNVRVLQFSTETSSPGTKNKLYSEAGNSDANAWYTQDASSGLITVNTGTDDFTNVNSRFYIVVNAGDGLSAVTNESGLKSSWLTFSDMTTEPNILTFGPVSYTKVVGTTKAVALFAKLRRAYAKVTVQYTLSTGIAISSVDIENVPDKIYPFPETSATTAMTYLAPFSITPFDTPSDTPSGNTPAKYEFTFYMPENLKGSGTATVEADRNFPEKGPGNSLEGCTCIVMKGTYNYYPGISGSEPIEVEYRFYLGSDMVGNYSVERGKHYTLTVNLKGANSADARVNITDGNVFTFEEPEDVNNGMTFSTLTNSKN